MRTTRLIASVLTVMAAGSLGSAVFAPIADADVPIFENRAATTAVAVLTDNGGQPDLDSVPQDFAEVIGYQPTVRAGMVVNPHGSCSSPVPLPTEFDLACKAHDFGYDLLRYAHSSGTDLGEWARRRIDAQFDRRIHDVCDARNQDRAMCFAMANTATTAVGVNSWRHGYGAPVDEPWVRYFGAAALAAAGSVVIALLVRRIRAAS